MGVKKRVVVRMRANAHTFMHRTSLTPTPTHTPTHTPTRTHLQVENAIPVDRVTLNSLLDMYAMRGEMESANAVVEDMRAEGIGHIHRHTRAHTHSLTHSHSHSHSLCRGLALSG